MAVQRNEEGRGFGPVQSKGLAQSKEREPASCGAGVAHCCAPPRQHDSTHLVPVTPQGTRRLV